MKRYRGERYRGGLGLKECAFLGGVATMLASALPEAKASKTAVHYQDLPNGMRMCQICKFFISAGGGALGWWGAQWEAA